MRLAFYLGAVLPLFLKTTALHPKIPQVDSIINSVLEEFANYTTYHGPKHASAIIPRHADHETKRQTSTTPYWYESIAHQGISAFGPSGYKVYRNVKDFGAKGISPEPCNLLLE
jgi:glucan 1,3-beta-glucosidase